MHRRSLVGAGSLLLLLVSASPGVAHPGSLDKSFGGDGKVVTDFTKHTNDFARAVAIQPNGKIVAAGGTVQLGEGGGKFAVARYDSNGSLDRNFGGDGRVRTRFGDFAIAYGVAIQPDGRIVAAGGYIHFAVARYRPNGTLDRTFGGDGKVTTAFKSRTCSAAGVVIQPDGRIVVAGGCGVFAAARYMPSGKLDETFGGDGRVRRLWNGNIQVYGVALQPDGKIVVVGGGSKFVVARFNPHGSLDQNFGGDGIVTTDFTKGSDWAQAVDVQADGKIVAAGGAGYDVKFPKFALARYRRNGTLDRTFGGNGKVTTAFGTHHAWARAMTIQADGKILAAGYRDSHRAQRGFAVARYRTNGFLDPTFGGDGRASADFTLRDDFGNGVAIQPDGKIVVAGDAHLNSTNPKFALARFRG